MFPPAPLVSRAYDLAQLDTKLSDDVLIENLNLLAEHKLGQKYCVLPGNKLCIEDRYLQFARRWWTSDGWAKTSEAIELTLRKVELITEAAVNTRHLIQNPDKVPRIADIMKKAWFKAQQAAANSVLIGKDYKNFDKDESASKQITEMATVFDDCFKKYEWRTFFIDKAPLLAQLIDNYFHSEVTERIYNRESPEDQIHELMIEVVRERLENEQDNEVENLDEEKKTSELINSNPEKPFFVSNPIPIITMTKHGEENGGSILVSEHYSNEDIDDIESNKGDIRNRIKKSFSKGIIDDINAEKNNSESQSETPKMHSCLSLSPLSASPGGFFKGMRYYGLNEWPNY